MNGVKIRFGGLKFLVLAVGIVGASGCSMVSVTSSAKYDPNVDYGRFKTFDWMPQAESGDNLQQTVIAAEMGHIIRSEVEKGLGVRGFTKATGGKPDFYLNYHGWVQEKIEPQVVTYSCGRSFCGQGVDMNRIREGTLILDIIQADNNEVVWRGTAVARGVNPYTRQEAIEKAVGQLLKVFPPE
jgi:Domain of unknown function (DUF4136)